MKLTDKQLEQVKGHILRPLAIKTIEITSALILEHLTHEQATELLHKHIDTCTKRFENIMNVILEGTDDSNSG